MAGQTSELQGQSEAETRQPLLTTSSQEEPCRPSGDGAPSQPKEQAPNAQPPQALPAAPSTQQEHLLQPPAPEPAFQATPTPTVEGVFLGPQGATMWGTPHPGGMQHSYQQSEALHAMSLLAAAMGLPTIAGHWHALRPFLACWMVSSVINLVIFMMADGATTAFLFAEIAAIIGVVAGARATIPACREGVDILTMAKQLHVMGALATLMDLFTLLITDAVLLTLALNCPDGQQDVCDMARPAAAFFTMVLGSHALLSFQAARGRSRSSASSTQSPQGNCPWIRVWLPPETRRVPEGQAERSKGGKTGRRVMIIPL